MRLAVNRDETSPKRRTLQLFFSVDASCVLTRIDDVGSTGCMSASVLSILDLAIVGRGECAADALANSVVLAQAAEQHGFRRVWYAEHHNMGMIASSAPAVLAEQFGTLATLHPGRIDLGLGRAPGSDQLTMRAMRRDHTSADRFPDDVLELQGYLRGESRVPGVTATPGAGTDVPLYILGSSLFGAQLAALLGLPFAFASHFAPAALTQAVAIYRREFRPSRQLQAPYVMAALNVIAADTDDDADDQLRTTLRARVGRFLGRGDLEPDEAERLLATPQGQQIAQMMHYSAVGTPRQVAEYLEHFREIASADELVIALSSPTISQRVRSLELVAEVTGLDAPCVAYH
jgi:luciferase family oxidoreductase group 1